MFEYGRKNDLSKNLTYRIALVVEEMLVGIIQDNAEEIKKLNTFIEYNAKEGSAKVNFYLNGVTKEKITYDELCDKIFETYCKDIQFTENDEAYDLHISFLVNLD